MKEYKNARDVLPKALFEKVRKYYTGILYVPMDVDHQKRRRIVMMLRKNGADAKEIAAILGVTPSRIHKIIQEEREKMDNFEALEE